MFMRAKPWTSARPTICTSFKSVARSWPAANASASVRSASLISSAIVARYVRGLVAIEKPPAREMMSASIVAEQMKLPAQPTMNGDHGAIDVADQAVAEDDVRNFPVAAAAGVRQHLNTGTSRRLASRVAAQRLVRELRQFRVGLSGRRHQGSNQANTRADDARLASK